MNYSFLHYGGKVRAPVDHRKKFQVSLCSLKVESSIQKISINLIVGCRI